MAKRGDFLATTMLTGALAALVSASPAVAQDASSPASTDAAQAASETTAPVEAQTNVPSSSATGEPVAAAGEIVITGTRIPQPNLTSASPVTVLSSQDVKLSGTTRTE